MVKSTAVRRAVYLSTAFKYLFPRCEPFRRLLHISFISGKWNGTVDVAVKTLKDENTATDEFLAEATLMKVIGLMWQFPYPSIVCRV